MAKLVPDPESSTRALILPATGHRDTGVLKTLLRLYCVAGFMQGFFVTMLKDDKILETIVESGS